MGWELLVDTLLVLLLFAIHLASRRLEHIGAGKRSLIMSAAGGVSAAYVFLHLLPELRQREEPLMETVTLLSHEMGIYFLALLGLVIFFGLERMVVRTEEEKHTREVGPVLFWSHIGAFAINSFAIGHLLVLRDDSTAFMVMFALALGLHFMTNDHALRERHAKLHERHGRWILAGSVLLGCGAGIADVLPEALAAALFALLAGGIIFNVMKEELPSDRSGSFLAFAAGAIVYGALLISIA